MIETEVKGALARAAKSDAYWKPRSKAWVAAEGFALILLLAENLLLNTVQDVEDLPYRSAVGVGIAFLIGAIIVSIYSEKARARLYHYSQFVFALGIVLMAWDILTEKSGLLPMPFFPSAAQILQVMVEDYAKLLSPPPIRYGFSSSAFSWARPRAWLPGYSSAGIGNGATGSFRA